MFRKNLITLSFVLNCIAGSSHAADYALALSPVQQPDHAKAQVVEALKFITALDQGDNVLLFDGYAVEQIGVFKIPPNPAYRGPKARLAVNGAAVKALMDFAKSARVPSATGASQIGTVRLPQLLRTIAANHTSDADMDVIVLGSPLYDDPAEPAFTMTGGRYPSDGHLSRTRGETVFGAAGSPALLNKLRVHIGYGSNRVFASDRHQYFVERFWTLFIDAQGGQLVSFAADLSTVLERVRKKATAPPHGFKRDDNDKLEMIRLRKVDIRQSIYQRTLSTTPLPAAQVQRADRVEVGLAWDCADCDLDIYARANPDAALIYFDNTATPLGTLWKDHLTSPRASKGYETIAFNVPLDLRVLRLAVNFYQGDSPGGVNGELRLAVDGQTYSQPFHIQATTGNKGAGIKHAIESNQPGSAHTLIIDPLRIVSIP